MKTKKILSIILSICMLLSAVPMMAFPASAATGKCPNGHNMTYELDTNYYIHIGYCSECNMPYSHSMSENDSNCNICSPSGNEQQDSGFVQCPDCSQMTAKWQLDPNNSDYHVLICSNCYNQVKSSTRHSQDTCSYYNCTYNESSGGINGVEVSSSSQFISAIERTDVNAENIILKADITLTNSNNDRITSIQADKSIFLNGFTLNITDFYNKMTVGNGITFNIYGGASDSDDGDGELLGVPDRFNRIDAICVDGGTLNVYSGTVKGFGADSGNINIYGGTVFGVYISDLVNFNIYDGYFNDTSPEHYWLLGSGVNISGGYFKENIGSTANSLADGYCVITLNETDPIRAIDGYVYHVVKGVELKSNVVGVQVGGVDFYTATSDKKEITYVAPGDSFLPVAREVDGYTSVLTCNDQFGYSRIGQDGCIVTTSNEEEITVSVTYTAKPTFAITCATCTNGSVSADVSAAAQGATVTVTVTPDSGYVLDTLKYNDGTNDTTITKTGDDYTFQMPASAVTVSATFKTASYVCYIDANNNGTFDGSDVKYETIAKALTAAGTTATTIVMIADSTESVEIPEDAIVTLDLDGYVLTGAGESSAILNEGKLTIKDSNPTSAHTDVSLSEINGAVITGGEGTEEKINENVFETFGGAVYNFGELNIIGVTFTGNTADYGAAVYNYGKVDISDSTFTGNTAYRSGAVYNYGKAEISDSTFTGNTADYGGAVYNYGKAEISDSTFTDNTAYNGGAVYNYEKADISDSTFTGNTADSGGAVYNDSGDFIELKMTGCTLTKNEATNGGAVCLSDFADTAKASFYNCSITENTATEFGGGCYFGTDTWVIMDSCSVKKNTAEYGGGIMHKHRSDEKFTDYGLINVAQDKLALLNTEVSENYATKYGGIFFDRTQKSCFVKGTLVSMADGSTKKIEDVKDGDIVKTFDHETGKVSSAKVYISFKEQLEPQETFKLNFDGGFSVHCVASHTFLEKESRKYKTFNVFNAESYVGKYFYGEDGQWHKLESVSIEEKTEWLYEIYTAEHQNAFTNGMLSAPADVDYLLNIYELDENLKANEIQLQADIEKYGLVSFEYVNKNYGVSKEWYDCCGAKYVFVAIGKGLTSLAEVESVYAENFDTAPDLGDELQVIESYSPLLGTNDSSSSFDSDEFYENEEYRGVILIGDGTKITDNTEGENSIQSNLYLDADFKSYDSSYIRIYGTLTNADIGVTLNSKTGKFTTNGTSADVKYFSSDNTDYIVKHFIDHLELIQMPDEMKNAKYSASLTLKDNIDIKLKIKNYGADNINKLSVTADGQDVLLSLENGTVEGVLKSVSPEEIGKSVRVIVKYDGNKVEEFDYSVKKYCEAVFKAYESDNSKYAKLNAVCEALLNYGKYAEDYANKKAYDDGKIDTLPAASTLNEGHELDLSTVSLPESKKLATLNATYGGSKSGANLDIGSTIKLQYHLKSSYVYELILVSGMDNAEAVENGSFKSGDKPSSQNFFLLNEDNKQIDPAMITVTEETGGYLISVDLYAYQLANEYTLKVRDVDLTTFGITYGVYDYCVDAQSGYGEETANLCKTIYNYGQAVQAYIA